MSSPLVEVDRLSLPRAGQPDVVLAVQKDAYFRKECFDKVNKAVESVFGPHVSVAVRPESKLVSELAYFGFTSLRDGGQTPGEEYCDILHAQTQTIVSNDRKKLDQESDETEVSNDELDTAESIGDDSQEKFDSPESESGKEIATAAAKLIYVLPSAGQRYSLMFLTVIVPYLIKRIKSGGWKPLTALFKPPQTARERAEAFRRRLQAQQERRERIERGEDIDTMFVDDEQRSFFDKAYKLIMTWIPSVTKLVACAVFLERLHLAAFYIYGSYYSWKNRLVGLQYVNTREPKTEPMSYRILGYFLLSQIALESYPTLINLARTLMKTWGVTYDPPGTDQNTQEAASVVPFIGLGLEREVNETDYSIDENGTKGPLDVKCGICLSEPINNPAAPKCGHMFCYECILGSSLTKEECPVCRQSARPREIQCIYFS